MKVQIRHGVFETNSSSTHSITICTKQEFEDWKAGKVLWNEYPGEEIPQFVSVTEETKEVDPHGYDLVEVDEDYDNDDDEVYTFEEFKEMEYEQYIKHYKTPSGEEIVAFGYYGYQG